MVNKFVFFNELNPFFFLFLGRLNNSELISLVKMYLKFWILTQIFEFASRKQVVTAFFKMLLDTFLAIFVLTSL